MRVTRVVTMYFLGIAKLYIISSPPLAIALRQIVDSGLLLFKVASTLSEFGRIIPESNWALYQRGIVKLEFDTYLLGKSLDFYSEGAENLRNSPACAYGLPRRGTMSCGYLCFTSIGGYRLRQAATSKRLLLNREMMSLAGFPM